MNNNIDNLANPTTNNLSIGQATEENIAAIANPPNLTWLDELLEAKKQWEAFIAHNGLGLVSTWVGLKEVPTKDWTGNASSTAQFHWSCAIYKGLDNLNCEHKIAPLVIDYHMGLAHGTIKNKSTNLLADVQWLQTARTKKWELYGRYWNSSEKKSKGIWQGVLDHGVDKATGQPWWVFQYYAEFRYPPFQSRFIGDLPNLVDVLQSLQTDCQAANETFEDFCANFGGDTDSISSLRTWEKCCETERKVRALLGLQQYSRLMELPSL